ncbi:MAG TPA: hypothetical protein DD979_15455 [Gammaproteobacteria bacterium]|jgi:O-antigen/teichoic acid export membrane protein|nr:hypothetical protein [Gammaproteobacteria bacterium]
MQLATFTVYTGGRIVNATLSLITLVMINRMISPADYGRYAYITMIGGLLSLLCFGWIWSCNLRFGSERPFSEVYQNAIAWLILASPLVLLSVWVFSYFNPGDQIEYAYLIAYALLLALFNSEQKIHAATSHLRSNIAYALLRTATNLIALAALILFLNDHKNALYMASVLGYFSVLAALLWREVYRKNAVPKALPTSEQVSYGAGIAAAALITQVNYSLDKFVVNWALGDESTGQYYHSYEIIHFMIMFVYSIYNVNVYPPLQRLYDKNEITLQRVLRKSLTIFAAIAVVIVVCLFVGKPLIVGVISEEYRYYFAHLYAFNIIIALLTCFVAFNINYAFQLAKIPKIRVYIGAMAILVNLSLSLLLVNTHGMRGVACATILSQLFIVFSSKYYISAVWIKNHAR